MAGKVAVDGTVVVVGGTEVVVLVAAGWVAVGNMDVPVTVGITEVEVPVGSITVEVAVDTGVGVVPGADRYSFVPGDSVTAQPSPLGKTYTSRILREVGTGTWLHVPLW